MLRRNSPTASKVIGVVLVTMAFVSTLGMASSEAASGDTVTRPAAPYTPPTKLVSLNGSPVKTIYRAQTGMPANSVVKALWSSGIASLQFAQTSGIGICWLLPLSSAAAAQGKLTSRPTGTNFAFTLDQGVVECSTKPTASGNPTTNNPDGLCYSGSVIKNGNGLGQVLGICEDPLFEVAVFSGQFSVVDPSGAERVLSAGQEVSCNPVPTCVPQVGAAVFTAEQRSIFAIQAKEVE